jgi:hypothetical protein
MNPSSLRVTALERELATTRAELATTRKRLEAAVTSAERARRVRISPPRPGRTTHRTPGDTVRVLIPDTHGAKADRPALAALLTDLKTLDPDEIILLGDHVDCGGFLAQHHVLGYVAETAYSYEEDIAHANALLDQIATAAPRARLEYIEGNHERRVETWAVTQTLRHAQDSALLRRLVAPEYLLKLKERDIPYYRQGEFYDGLPVPGVIKRGKCFFFHGISTAKNAVAATIARIGGNCVSAHTHRAQSDIIRMVGTGVIGSWNPWCLCEMQPLWQHTAPTNWTHGYALQLVRPSGAFLHLNVPVLNGETHLGSLFKL